MDEPKTLQVYTQSEAARRLNWTCQRLHKALKEGRVTGAVKTLGGTPLIPRRVVDRLAKPDRN